MLLSLNHFLLLVSWIFFDHVRSVCLFIGPGCRQTHILEQIRVIHIIIMIHYPFRKYSTICCLRNESRNVSYTRTKLGQVEATRISDLDPKQVDDEWSENMAIPREVYAKVAMLYCIEDKTGFRDEEQGQQGFSQWRSMGESR